MSLIEPNIIDTLKRYKTVLVVGGLGLLLVGVALFLYDCGEGAWFRSKVQKQKDAIAETVEEIKDKTNQIAELEKEKAALAANVNTATQQLQEDLFGLDEAKQETNQALANLQKVVEANGNVNRSAEDLIRILEKLDNE